ncbi:MAG: glycosyltransferase family 2 protein [Candidatus Pacearchaeota archaeon]|nr:glycosyltransferase family 2 protein [Candidatus Pacearchaeota archaeon]
MPYKKKSHFKKFLVVIPAYNEEDTIKEVIQRTLPYCDICVVNDASKDDTEKIVNSFKTVTCITHKKNTHIPGAILDGFRYAVEKNYDYIITMDAGLSHKPEELPRFINFRDCDLVLSVRKNRTNVPLTRKILSKSGTMLINIALRPIGSNLPKPRFHDITSGYRRYSNRAARLLLNRKMKAKSFDFLTESLMFIYRNKMTIKEVQISYKFSNSSLNRRVIIDSLKMFLNILLSRRK